MNGNGLGFKALALGLVIGAAMCASADQTAAAKEACAADNAGLTLPDGFCATVFAESTGQPRHMAAGADGTLYVNTWLSPFKPAGKRPDGGFIAAFSDTNGDGVADKVGHFDAGRADSKGGTGIALHGGYLYAEDTGSIVRFKLKNGETVPKSAPETVLSGLVDGGHNMHPFVITKDGALYVNSGSFSNSCQQQDRSEESPGKDPCDELPMRAGIWKYSAEKLGQTFGPAERFVSGMRNSVALALTPSDVLYTVPHGRDQLFENWPKRFNAKQGSELPAEALYRPEQGKDYGWPYCYYDGAQKKYVLAPEYGGDGKKVGRCTGKPEPVAAFPAHWAPNGVVVYSGTAFPEHYRGGVFIAFHGSWNRQPADQGGYNVVFQPLDAAGKASAPYEVFADGFAGAKKSPFDAAYRPTGIAMGADGALYVSDDQGGRIYRIARR